MSDELTGKIVGGQYTLLERLGDGAMGVVYRAQDIDGTVVAVKMPHAFLQRAERFRERFEIEAAAMTRLNDPRCVKLYTYGVDPKHGSYMAVEFVTGVGLDTLIGELSVDTSVQIALDVGEVLEVAHREGILHRDLTPENIRVQQSDGQLHVKLMDFGLAKLIDVDPQEDPTTHTRRRRVTKVGEILGSPRYLPPEMCQSGKLPTQSSDIYALGLILYEMLAGRPAFVGTSPIDLMMKQMKSEPEALNEDLPDDLRQLVAWMIKKDPDDRPRAMQQVNDVLRRHLSKARKVGLLDTLSRTLVLNGWGPA